MRSIHITIHIILFIHTHCDIYIYMHMYIVYIYRYIITSYDAVHAHARILVYTVHVADDTTFLSFRARCTLNIVECCISTLFWHFHMLKPTVHQGFPCDND